MTMKITTEEQANLAAQKPNRELRWEVHNVLSSDSFLCAFDHFAKARTVSEFYEEQYPDKSIFKFVVREVK